MSTRSKVFRTDPELWEACKKEALEKTRKFSARAMQQAVLVYKQRGGGYLEKKSPTLYFLIHLLMEKMY